MLLPSPTRSTVLRFALTALTAGALATGISAQPVKRGRRSQPVPTAHAAPDVTSTIARASGATPQPTPTADEEALPAPFNLPAAPRARVRACGESWQAMKLAGQAGDETWREYATKCLANDAGAKSAAVDIAGVPPTGRASANGGAN